jgi:hypothetical protein
VIRWDKERYPKISEGLLQLAVASYVQWWRNYVVPNLCLFHEMDVAVLTRAGCLWEFEIKLSQRDWETDNRKDVKPAWILDRAEELRAQGIEPESLGWVARPRRNLTYVERFYYVVAPDLVAPDWVPEWAGILRAEVGEGWYGRAGPHIRLTPERAAKRRYATKPTEKHREAILRSAYHRFWGRVMQMPNAAELVARSERESSIRD